MGAHRLSDGVVWLSRPLSTDVDAIARACQHSSISEWTTLPAPYLRTDAQHFVDVVVPAAEAAGECVWAVRTEPDGEAAGMVGLHDCARDRDHSAEIGFWLAPAVRSRGLMTRAVNLVCDFAFRADGLGLNRVEWRAFTGNYGSAAVARRAGFRFEGTLRLGGSQRGAFRDTWIAGRLAADPPGGPADWPAETSPAQKCGLTRVTLQPR